MKIHTSNLLNKLILFYLYFPVLIFIIGWCNIFIALIGVLVSLYSIWTLDKQLDTHRKFLTYHLKDTFIKNKIPFAVGFGGLLFFCFCVGIGRFTNQSGDWAKHNTIISDLLLYDWPVIYKTPTGDNAMLCYYILHYLPAALIGKLCGSFRIAELFYGFWIYLGIIFIYLRIVLNLQIGKWWQILLVPIILIMFSYPLFPANLITQYLFGWTPDIQCFYWNEGIILVPASNFQELYYAPPQVVMSWLSALIFIENIKHTNIYVPLLIPGLLYGAFPFLGIFIIALISALYIIISTDNVKIEIKNIFSYPNIVCASIIGGIFITYLLGNIMGAKPEEVSFHLVDYSGRWHIYFMYLFLVLLPYWLLLFHENKTNLLYIISFIIMIFLPLFSMGINNDFGRVSECIILVLIYSLISYLTRTEYSIKNFRLGLITLLFIISSYYSVIRINNQFQNRRTRNLTELKHYGTMGEFTNRDDDKIFIALRYNYFAYDLENCFFYNHIAKR